MDVKLQKIISETFSINGGIKEIVEIGDKHINGAVSRIIFKDDNSVIYKPRSAVGEKILYDIESHVYSILNMENYNPNIYISTNEFTLFEDIKESDNLETDYISYFYQIGVKSSILYLLGASDISYENVLLHKSQPIIIDSETLFSPDNINYNNINWNHSLSYYSVSRIGIFPSNYIFSCIYTAKQKKHLIENVPSIYEEIKKFPMITPEYQESIVNGFNEGIDILNLLFNEKILHQIISFYSRDLLNLRVIIKPTFIYYNFLKQGGAKELFNNFEIEQLNKNVIPRFTFDSFNPKLNKHHAIKIIKQLLTFCRNNKKFMNAEIIKLCND